ncbi:hypothetical protein JXB12_01000 [candidate division KSB1 bacterium]|nr:hypothetical protein [candidate division KSB1 bacterium]
MSKEKTVVLECISNKKKIIKIRFTRELSSYQSTAYLITAIKKCMSYGFYKIIIDMENIDSTVNNMTATLIEVTSKVRRKDGDIKLINLSEQLHDDIAGFNALTFLLHGSPSSKK